MAKLIDNENEVLWEGDDRDELNERLSELSERERLELTVLGLTHPEGRAPDTGDRAPNAPEE